MEFLKKYFHIPAMLLSWRFCPEQSFSNMASVQASYYAEASYYPTLNTAVVISSLSYLNLSYSAEEVS